MCANNRTAKNHQLNSKKRNVENRNHNRDEESQHLDRKNKFELILFELGPNEKSVQKSQY